MARFAVRICRTAAACAALGALAFPAVAAADTSFPGVASDLAARGAQIVWAGAPGPASRLMVGFGANASPLPVPAASFDGLDLGTDARGRTVLVYSACRMPRASLCDDLYEYSFSSHRERRLDSLSRRGCIEYHPQISRGVLAFARQCGYGSSPRERRLGGLYLKRPGKPLIRLRSRPPSSFDLAGKTLAFADEPALKGIEGRVSSEIRVLRLGDRHSRLVARTTGVRSRTSNGTFLSRLRIDGGFVYWQRDVLDNRRGDPDQPSRQDIVRRPIDGSKPAAFLERAGRLYADPLGDGLDDLGTYAVSGERLYYAAGPWQPRVPSFIAQVTPAPIFGPLG